MFLNKTYTCLLCESQFYIDSNGECQQIDDTNCFLSDGINNKCILCLLGY